MTLSSLVGFYLCFNDEKNKGKRIKRSFNWCKTQKRFAEMVLSNLSNPKKKKNFENNEY